MPIKKVNEMNNSKQNGMSLIEVLIALIIFSVGLLGIAGLQLVGMKTNHDSLIRTQATQLAQSIAEKMLANEEGVRAGEYTVSNIPSSTISQLGTLPSLNPSLGSMPSSESSSTPIKISQDDLFYWQQMLATQLPGGTGLISCINNPLTSSTATCSEFSQGAIIISWQERGNRGTTSAGSMVFKKVVLNILL